MQIEKNEERAMGLLTFSRRRAAGRPDRRLGGLFMFVADLLLFCFFGIGAVSIPTGQSRYAIVIVAGELCDTATATRHLNTGLSAPCDKPFRRAHQPGVGV